MCPHRSHSRTSHPPCREESLSKQVKHKAIKDKVEVGEGKNSYFHDNNKWWENKFIWSKWSCTEVELNLALSCFAHGSTRVNLCSSTPGRSLSGRCWSSGEWSQSHEVPLCCSSWWQPVQPGRAQRPGQWIWQDQASITQLWWGAEERSQTCTWALHLTAYSPTGLAFGLQRCTTRCTMLCVVPSAFFWGDNNTSWSIFNSVPWQNI